jgi:hypothetical protein
MRSWMLFAALVTMVLAPQGPAPKLCAAALDHEQQAISATGEQPHTATRVEQFPAGDFVRVWGKTFRPGFAFTTSTRRTLASVIVDRPFPAAALLPLPTPTLQLQHVRLQP